MADTSTLPTQGYVQKITTTATTVVAEATGFAALTESYLQLSTDPTSSSSLDPLTTTTDSSDPTSSPTQSSEENEQEKEEECKPAREDHSEELEKGPSHPKRPEQTQKTIGTESGIPTTAGAGTTLSPDDDVKAAYKKEQQRKQQQSKSNNNNNSAAARVGVDYSDQPCPTADARREKATSQPAQGKLHFNNREEQLHGGGGETTTSSEESDVSDSTAATSTTGNTDSESTKVGMKDKLRGNAKVIAGKLTRNDEKVESGKLLKAGTAHA